MYAQANVQLPMPSGRAPATMQYCGKHQSSLEKRAFDRTHPLNSLQQSCDQHDQYGTVWLRQFTRYDDDLASVGLSFIGYGIVG